MSTTNKPSWPKTVDGVTDWEIVFEDPKKGLVGLVDKVDSIEALERGGKALVSKLFTRKGDDKERLRCMNLIDNIIANEELAPDLKAKKQFVTRLLRGIKTTRQEEAADYLKRKRRGAALERRKKKEAAEKRIRLIAYGAVGLIIAVGLYYFLAPWVIDFIKADSRVTGPAVVKEMDEIKSTFGDKPKEEGEAEPVNAIILNPVKWTFSPRGNKKRTIYYSPVLNLNDPSFFPDICRYLPSVLDTIYETMSKTLPYDQKPDPDALSIAGIRAGLQINQALERDVFSAVMLRSDIPDRDKQNTRLPCRPFRENSLKPRP